MKCSGRSFRDALGLRVRNMSYVNTKVNNLFYVGNTNCSMRSGCYFSEHLRGAKCGWCTLDPRDGNPSDEKILKKDDEY